MLRKFGFKKSEPRESEARLKLQKELFAYNKLVEHGFPNKPSALAYDPKLKLIAIGTKTGSLKVLGQPGVEFSAEHKNDVAVNQLFFLPEQGRLISLCSDNSLHLWEINVKNGESVLEEVKEHAMEQSKLKTVSACCLTSESDQLLLGTEGGNIHLLDVVPFTVRDQVIFQDVVMQNVPDDFKVNPGAVESIAQSPSDPNKFLIGYNRGLIVLWDLKESNADQTYNATQQLESLSWHRDGTQFMSAHADGSYIVWATNDSTKPKEQANTPYGPFPCKSINKIVWNTAKADNVIVFAGGMPRPSYADRHTVSVTQGAKQVVYDFTSRVVDFLVFNSSQELDDPTKPEHDDPHTVLVLVEEEIVAIDLTSENWPTYKQPYLCSPHSSAITCASHVDNVPEQLWKKIQEAGESQMSSYSGREWPVTGGKVNHSTDSTHRDLLLTGHEDGTVRFWDTSSIAMNLMYKMSTTAVFGLDFGSTEQNDGEEEWPPFRKVGTFDPYSDDPRLGIQKISICPTSERLVVGGTAGQVVIMGFETTEKDGEISSIPVNIVSDRDNFVWKGHEELKVAEGSIKQAPGFQASSVIQLHPPAACTALALQSEWQLVAVGTAHGFGLVDYAQKKEVTTKCTLNPNADNDTDTVTEEGVEQEDLTGTGDSAMARRKSFKKSLRESFRRLRKRRSERRKRAEEKDKEEKKEDKKEDKKEEGTSEAKPAEEGAEKKEGEGETASPAPAAEADTKPAEGASASPATTPTQDPAPKEAATTPTSVASEVARTIERAVEFRNTDDTMASMVRTLYFADTFLINAQNHSPTLWAGTNAGTIFVFQITMPANDKRDSEDVQCVLGKEIHLKHRAPVVSICIIDRNACPLPSSLDSPIEGAKAPDMTGNHQVVICSEEQFKIFSLPNLKPQNKYKLTAHEGSKVRKVNYIRFPSRSDAKYTENDLVVLTNMGDVQIFTVPHLRRQLKAETIRKENVNGIVSCVLSRAGEGFFPTSPSEFMRFSLSAALVNKPDCEVELAEGMRPPPPEPEPEPEPTQEEGEGTTEAAPEGGAGGDGGDGAAEGDKADEQAPAEGANESTLTADLTIDSVKVHLSDDNPDTKLVSQSFTRSVVTKTTVISSSSDEGTKVVTKETKTVTQSDADGAAASTTTETITTEGGGGESTTRTTVTTTGAIDG